MALSEELADRLLNAIIDGTYPPDEPLPPESELAAQHEVSRLTAREAVKSLRTQNIVRIERGRGTYVNDPDNWTALDPVIRANANHTHGVISESLLEARVLLEAGAAELAATKRSEQDLDELRAQLAEMRVATEQSDVDSFVRADIAFHDTIMRASGNVFVSMMFEPFGRLLFDGRHETSSVAEIRTNAVAQHDNIVHALDSADPERSRQAMSAHMRQTHDDLHTYVLHGKHVGERER